MLGIARAAAIQALKLGAEIEKDDNGKVISVTFEGVRHEDVAKAAAVFLKNNPFFASNGGASGGGTKSPAAGNGGAGSGGRALIDHSDEELLAMSNRQRAARS